MLLMISASFVLAKGDYANSNDKQQSLNKTTGAPSYAKFNINRISTVFKNDGLSDLSAAGNSGFVYPILSNRTAFYESGFIYGGKINGETRVGGSTFRRGQVPGAIKADGTAEDPNADHVRIYKVRRDYKTGNLATEAADDDITVDEVYNQYELDWNEWPAAYGAPYEDIDDNGSYNAAVDIPGEPGADQTIWFVCNDLDAVQSQFLYGSLPMGVEMQATIFGYNQTGALGHMLFRKYLIINKSQNDFEDFYTCMWSDPDLGDATDDYTGVDSTLSLGMIYNGDANDATYGSIPPAGGFDFFQGPIVDGEAEDQAIFRGRVIHGKKNLGVSAFFFFINSDPVYSDPNLGEYAEGTLEMYNLFQGKIGTTSEYFVDPNTGQQTKITLAGDPLTGSGWLDGQLHPPGDRRMGLVAGPFTMAAGDSQEVVVAQIVAGNDPGIDRLGAVGLLKFYDKTAQLIYDNFFQVVAAPAPPRVTTAELDQSVVISWGSDIGRVNETESSNEGGFAFQGYNVYQLPTATASINEAARIATFDVIDGVGKITDEYFDISSGVVGRRVVQFGSDSGVKRFVVVNSDVFSSNLPLVNGTRYYFAVTAYSFNTDPLAVPNNLENPLAVFTLVPHDENPGVRLEGEADQELDVAHSVGKSDGVVTPIVVNPAELTGHQYRVTFGLNDDDEKVWNLVDVTTGQTKLSNQFLPGPADVTALGTNTAYIVDGIQVGVVDAPPQIKGPGTADGLVEVAYAGTPLPANKYDVAGAQYFGNKVWQSGNSTGGDRYFVTAGNNGNITSLYRWVQFASPRDFELRFTAETAYGVYGFTDDQICTVPFEIWDIGIGTPNDPSDDRRMIPLINDNDGTAAAWQYTTGTDPTFGYPMSDWIYWMDPKDKTFGDVGYQQFANSCVQSGGPGAIYNYAFDTDPTAGDYNTDMSNGFVYPIGRFAFADLDLDGNPPPAGTVIRLNYTKPITVDDQYTFAAPAVTVNTELAKEDVKKINVFPNPYYGVNSEELNKYQRFITFNHLPTNATLRVFNLAGQLVRTIEKNSNSQFERWDLLNNSGLPVASGLYIVYIDMPDLGTTKTVKAAIIQEQQILDRF